MVKVKFPKITASPHKGPRNAFDLSQTHKFSAPLGALLPILSLNVKANDYVKISTTDFMRCMPMNSSAFIDAKGCYEFFYVPYAQLWHPFDQFITSMKDYRSSSYSSQFGASTPTSLPYFSFQSEYADTLADDSHFDSLRDEFGIPLNFGIQRLFDLFGFGTWWKSDGSRNASSVPNYRLNVFRALAYQKIYQDFYRNTQYEPFDVKSYNIDDVVSSINPSRSMEVMFRLHYRNYGVDLLTNVRPSALLSSAPISALNALQPRNYQATEVSHPDIKLQEGFPTGNGNVQDVVLFGNNSPSTSSLGEGTPINVSSLRAAFAYDKLLQTMGRAGKTYHEQMKAIYGVDAPVGRDHLVTYIGGFNSPYEFSDQNNMTGNNSAQSSPYSKEYLGQSVGKGTAGSTGNIKFKVPEPGIIMCIYSVIPSNCYDNYRVDAFNLKFTRNDFYMPFYDHLGLQPLYRGQINAWTTSSWSDSNDSLTEILGWQPRYSEYKTAIDLNHGQFLQDGPLSYYTSSRARGMEDAEHDYLANGLRIKDFKVNPFLFDSIFAVRYNGKQTTDPFYGQVHFNIVAVRDMDIASVPNV